MGMNESRKQRDGLSLKLELSELVEDHHLCCASVSIEREKAKKDAIGCGIRVSNLMVDALNSDVQLSFINQKRIEVELRSLSATISRFNNLTSQLLLASNSLNSSLKEIGDFENWIKVIQYDCKTITAAISNIHQADRKTVECCNCGDNCSCDPCN